MSEHGTDKYKWCNHHHEIDDQHEMITIDGENFVANIQAIPLLIELNKIGLKTRSHHIDGNQDNPYSWVTILLDNVEIEIRDVNEIDADRTRYNGKKELLIQWKKTLNKI